MVRLRELPRSILAVSVLLTPRTADRADLDTQVGKTGHLLPVKNLARLMLGEYERIPLL